MKILLVNKFLYPRGGSESYMLELGAQYVRMGHEVFYFGMADAQNQVGEEQYGVRPVDFHKRSPRQLLYPFEIIWSPNAAVKMGRLLDEHRPDVVHLNNINFQLTPSILPQVQRRGIPLLMTLHDSQLVCPSHTLFHAGSRTVCESCSGGRYVNCVRNRCIHGSRIKSALGAIEAQFHRMLRSYDAIDCFISPSRALKEEYRRFGFDVDRIVHVTNFAEVPEDMPRSQKGGYVLYVGRISPEKGIRVLIEAARRSPEIHYIVAGSGPLDHALRGISNLEAVGFQKGEALSRLMREANATICPSICFENCPMSILESMAAGTLAVGSRIGGIPELLDDGRCGILVPVNDPDALAQAVRTVMHDADGEVRRMTENAFQRVRGWNLHAYAEQMLSLYEDWIERNRADGWRKHENRDHRTQGHPLKTRRR